MIEINDQVGILEQLFNWHRCLSIHNLGLGFSRFLINIVNNLMTTLLYFMFQFMLFGQF